MIIFGIETSCDETAAAIVEDGVKEICSVVASSKEFHEKTGGIVPEIAARKQVEAMVPVISECFEKLRLARGFDSFCCKQQAEKCYETIDAVAVTIGPGLIGSLVVGIEAAKALSLFLNKPLIPVNHLVGHIYGNFIDNPEAVKFPAIVLVVSGGHTDLILMKNHGEIEYLGGTLDDAAGEAYDKVAKFLNLGYPGGPIIDKLTNKMTQSKYSFTIPKIKNVAVRFIAPDINENLDFSFSGLKTAVINLVKQKFTNAEKIPESEKKEIAFAFQETTVNYLLKNTKIAIDKSNVKTVVFAGGVAANSRLRKKALALTNQQTDKPTNRLTEIYFPSISLCTDNAAMVAGLAYHKILCKGLIYASPTKPSFEHPTFLNLNAVPNLKIG